MESKTWPVNEKSFENLTTFVLEVNRATKARKNAIVILRDAVGAPENAIISFEKKAFIIPEKKEEIK